VDWPKFEQKERAGKRGQMWELEHDACPVGGASLAAMVAELVLAALVP